MVARLRDATLSRALGAACLALAACPDSEPLTPVSATLIPSPGDTTTGEPNTSEPDTAGEPSSTTDAQPGTTTGVDPCEPDACGADACGQLPDGCGGMLDCGGCPEGLACGGGGTANECGTAAFSEVSEVWSTSETAYEVRTLAWSPDGGRIASGGHSDFPTEGEFVVWNAMSGTPVWGYAYPKRYMPDLAWRPDGTQIVGGNGPFVWDAASGKQLVELIGCHDGVSLGVDWRPDGKTFASGGEAMFIPGAMPEWCDWDAEKHIELHAEPEPETYAVYDVAYSPDGKRLASSTDRAVAIYSTTDYSLIDAIDFKFVLGWDVSLDGIAWSPGGDLMLVRSSSAYFVLDFTSSQVRGPFEFPQTVTGITWSPSGHRYAISIYDGRVRIYRSADDSLELQFNAHTHTDTVDWSFHEQFLATGGDSPRLVVWRLD